MPLLFGATVLGAPPSIDVRPGLGDALVSDAWQPVVVTLTNEEGGGAVAGEVQVTVEEPRTEAAVATYARPIALPAGAGRAETTVYVRVPGGTPPEVSVALVSSGGDLVTQARFEKLAFRPESLTLVAVAGSDDELAGLRGARFGVFQTGGALRPAPRPTSTAPQTPRRPWQAGEGAEQPLRIDRVLEPGLLPDRAAGYDAAGVVYLGDVPPAAFSDAQVDALRGFASRGGLLVARAGPQLRSDERFRSLLPVPPAAGSPAATRPLGRGRVATLPAQPPISPDALRAVWAGLLRSSLAPPLIGRALEGGTGWQPDRFAQSVLHAPGLRPPSALAVGLFLGGYLVVLVPVNFLLLRRLRRTEWAWWTVPALVAAASLLTYRAGVAAKGGETLLNVASVAEMAAGDGTATVTGSVGLFSPARRAYDVAVTAPGALLEAPREADLRSRRRRRGRGPGDGPGGGSAGERPPIVDVAPRSGGAEARDAAVPMWAMRTFRVRADAVKIGDGLHADLRRQGDEVVGTLENRTGRALEDVVVYGPGGRQRFDALAPGATTQVRFTVDPSRAGRGSEFESPLGRMGLTPYGKSPDSPEALRARIGDAIVRDMANSLGTVLTGQRVEEAAGRRGAGLPPAPSVTIAAWSLDPLLPVTVDGEAVGRGAYAGLLLVRAPVR